MRGLVIEVDGAIRQIDINPETCLADMQKAVGGYIELIGLERFDFWVDEEGKRKGKPINIKATTLLLVESKGRRTDFLVGDVLLLGKAIKGDPSDLPQKISDKIVSWVFDAPFHGED
jgi:hypothetical protein